MLRVKFLKDRKLGSFTGLCSSLCSPVVSHPSGGGPHPPTEVLRGEAVSVSALVLHHPECFFSSPLQRVWISWPGDGSSAFLSQYMETSQWCYSFSSPGFQALRGPSKELWGDQHRCCLWAAGKSQTNGLSPPTLCAGPCSLRGNFRHLFLRYSLCHLFWELRLHLSPSQEDKDGTLWLQLCSPIPSHARSLQAHCCCGLTSSCKAQLLFLWWKADLTE